MRTFQAYALATLAFIAGTWVAPWVIVPILAAVLYLVSPSRFTAGRLAWSAALAWGLILAWTALAAPVRTLAVELGEIIRVPWPVVVLATPALAALLAWSGAGVAGIVRERSLRVRT